GLRGEELRRQVDEPDVVVAGDEPQLDRRHPRDRLLLAQAHVDRIGITLQLRQRDRLTERHTRLPSGRRDGVFWARTIEPRKESAVRYRPAVPSEEDGWTSKGSDCGSSTPISTAWSAASTSTARERWKGSRRSASGSIRSRMTR